jgi:predicted RNase H-like HicB family nuclease
MASVKLQTKEREQLKTFMFRVVVEPDEDRWFAYCPALEKYAATTWGYTKREALEHIREVVEMIVEELKDEEEKIPEEPQKDVFVSPGPHIAVTVS